MSRFGYLLAVMLLAAPVTAQGADVTVEMLNKDPNSNERNIYAPGLVQIEPGDTVTWVSTDRGHNVEFVRGAFPDGVDNFRSSLNKDVSYTFTVPGVYVYKCTPHYGMGMVGVVIVGEVPDNLADIMKKKYPGKADARIDALLAPLT
ncbi:MAG: pseudoazurin [Alphaproteobacteria bacterium]|nr:pseudoazurin [Alphaproteobacteria bacterium]